MAFLDKAVGYAGDAQAGRNQDCSATDTPSLCVPKVWNSPLVFLTVGRKYFPSKMSLKEPGRLGRERRLATWGITRGDGEALHSPTQNLAVCLVSESFNSPSPLYPRVTAGMLEKCVFGQQVSRPIRCSDQITILKKQTAKTAVC